MASCTWQIHRQKQAGAVFHSFIQEQGKESRINRSTQLITSSSVEKKTPQREFEADLLDFLYCWLVILVLFPIAVLKYLDKSNLREDGLTVPDYSLLFWGSQGSGN